MFQLSAREFLVPKLVTHAAASRSITTVYKSYASAPEGSPTVFDNCVDLIFVDPDGARRKAKGYIGTCLML
jgi:hypothetical protein